MNAILKTITLKHICGGVVLFAFLSGHLLMLFYPIPEQNKESFIHSLGMLDGAFIVVTGYYFGSSSGSKQKSELIESELKKANQ